MQCLWIVMSWSTLKRLQIETRQDWAVRKKMCLHLSIAPASPYDYNLSETHSLAIEEQAWLLDSVDIRQCGRRSGGVGNTTEQAWDNVMMGGWGTGPSSIENPTLNIEFVS